MADQGMYSLLVDIRANIASLKTDMDRATGILTSSGSKMSKVMEGVAQGIGQAFGKYAIEGVVNLSHALTALAEKGEKAGDVFDNFKSLGGSATAIEAARKAVLGTVSAFDLMQAANAGLIKGIPNLNGRFAELVEYSHRFAEATGQETVPVLNNLIQALGTGSQRALKEFGFNLQEGASKSKNVADALAQVAGKMATLAPITDSVTTSHEAFSTAMQDAIKHIAIGINESGSLAKGYRDLAVEIEKINWREVGDNIGYVAGKFGELLSKISSAIGPLNDFASKLRNTFDLAEQGAAFLKIKQLELQKMVQSSSPILSDYLPFDLPGAAAQREKQKKDGSNLDAQIASAKQESNSLLFKKLFDSLSSVQAPQFKSNSTLYGAQSPQDAGYQWNSKTGGWVKPSGSSGGGSGSGGGSSSTSREQTDQKKLLDERSKALADMADEDLKARTRVEELLARKREDSVQTWANEFQQVFSGSILQLFPSFGKLAGEFGQSLSEGLVGLFSDSKGSSGGLAGSFSSFLGSGLSTNQAHSAGVSGPGMADGSFGPDASAAAAVPSIGVIMQAGQAAMQFIQDMRGARKTDAANNNFSGTGSVLAQLILGNQLGGPLGSAIGGMMGRGPQNKETQGRHQFANYIEDQAAAKGGFTVYDGKGGQSKLTNFMEGSSSKFNDPKWADKLNSQSAEVQKTFSGLGEAFKNLLGITEDVGGQIAAMLGDNLKFNIDSARLMVKKLGLSFEEIEKQLVDIGLKGEKTWLEIETDIQGVAEAFKPGIAAVGDFAGAMNNLLGSGARGAEAVKSVKDIAVEAGEAGIKSFEALRVELLKTFDPATVDAFFAALKQRGVTSIGELMQISDRTAGGIVADMQALGVKFTDSGKKIGDGLSANTSSTDSNTQALNANTKALGGSAPDPAKEEEEIPIDETTVARKAVRGPRIAMNADIATPRRGAWRGGDMMGNITSNGKGGGYVVNVDARGAGHGVEKTIRSAMQTTERRVMESMGRSARRNSRRTT